MKRVQRDGDWLSAQVGEEVVMMSARKGSYIGMNAVGARIWELIERPMTVDDICTRLVAEFEVERDVCQTEVERFLDELGQQGAITFEAGAH